MAYQFKIKLRGISKPPVWRRVVVSKAMTFNDFHKVIQGAFGWEGYHLFQFSDQLWSREWIITLPDEDSFTFAEQVDAAEVTLQEYFEEGYDKILYVYDFGDEWVHEIVLEKRLDLAGGKAQCIAGKGCCPPEDSGGPFGYEMMKDILDNDPKSPEGKSYRQWLGLRPREKWDAACFSLEEANMRIEYFLYEESE